MSEFLDNVATAADAMRDLFAQTPLQENVFLSQRYDANILLKREDLSPVRSYKIRGAFNFFRKCLATSNPASFVCASAGNHAQGFAYVCQYFGKKGVIFMPVTTPQQKIDKTRAFGGSAIEIRLIGDIFDQCYAAANEYAQDNNAMMVSPFDHLDIIEGQATVAHEVLSQMADGQTIDRIHVAVGGGGLSSGLARYFSDMKLAPEFMFVEPLGAPSLKRSLAKGERVDVGHVDNFVDGASVALMGEYPFEILKRFSPDNVNLVPEDRLCLTMIEMLNVEGIVLEPAGALSVDALKDVQPHAIKGKNVLCIASGGNFDFERLAEVKERALRHSGVKKYFVLRLPQRPGALRDFLNLLGPDDDIARFEYLKKSARNFGSILIGIETKDAGNFAGLMARMTDSGIVWQDITDNQLVAGLLI
ncbi:threonine ammonia-lyase IlvA [Ahrensia kielensis]|uniref:L-threonine dehydratase n=1 Tax=Ahrensia kielensis TaxID=76980 RepID=A0ABU9T5H1_9HYPH